MHQLRSIEQPWAHPRLLLLRLGLLGLLLVEVVGMIAYFEAPFVDDAAEGAAWLFANSKEIWHLGLGFIFVVLLGFTARLSRVRQIIREFREQTVGYRVWFWLIAHLLALAAFVVITSFIFAKPTDPARLTAVWFAAWFALAGATFLLWLFAVAPGRFWWRLACAESGELLGGLLLGVPAGLLLLGAAGQLAREELWTALAGPTLWLVHQLLGVIYADLVQQPELFWIGTPTFQVEIFGPCSGYEGIILITVFLTIYLALFHRGLRFPQVLWLFPLGIIAIWLANAVRIALLIVVGTSLSPQIAVEGFHSQAGWIAFVSIALGLVVLSRRTRFFRADRAGSAGIQISPPLASALLVPLIVLLAASMVTSAFSDGFQALYPLGVVATAAALWHYRTAYRELGWTWSWQALALGVAVFLVWIVLEAGVEGGQSEEISRPAALSTRVAAVWWVFRIVGFVFIVPLVEELAFRGYLLRKLVASDFEKVRLDQFNWLSFVASSVLFGLLHEQWLAGTLAGMAYALAVYRRGHLGDAVLAHLTTNALLAVWMLLPGRSIDLMVF